MGNVDTKLNFRKAIVQLGTKNQTIDASDDTFWEQFWSDHSTGMADVFALVPANEIRTLRHDNPANLATLCYKATERLVRAVDNSCRTQAEQNAALNCIRLMTRILPYIFEDADWSDFFWSSLPAAGSASGTAAAAAAAAPDIDDTATPLAQSLLNAVCDLMFCPDFTVVATRRSGPDKAEELQHLDSCEYIWEAGVGFATSPARNAFLEQRRTELLKLLLCCFSETMYRAPGRSDEPNKWIVYFTSAENRHALPLFTSMLNTVCAYDPVGLGVPYNHFLFADTMEPLVEVCLQILIVTLDHDMTVHSPGVAEHRAPPPMFEEGCFGDNLFINYLSRVHRDEDFQFVLRGISRLLNNPLAQSYLPNSTKRLHCHQELLVFFWKLCDYNKKFLYYVLKSSDVLEILVPILYHLNDSRADQSRVGLMHIGVFILLLLSGERNFGVRLNKPYTATVPMDIPVFTGTHADLLITVFHKIIATGHQRLQPLFDCLLTILVNVSPYLKTLSMVAAIKLLHLLEAFSTPWFLFSAPSNHHLVFFLLEIFNNIIQYQFDGNANLVYTIIRKRHVFHALANLPADVHGISRCLSSRSAKGQRNAASRLVTPTPVAQRRAAAAAAAALQATTAAAMTTAAEQAGDLGTRAADTSSSEGDGRSEAGDISMEGSTPALPAEPGTLKVSLLDTPAIHAMTERESAHPAAVPTPQTPSGSVSTTGADFAVFAAQEEATDGRAGGVEAKLVDAPAKHGRHDAAADEDEEADDFDDDDDEAGSAAKVPVGAGGSPLQRAVAQRGSIRVTPTTTLAQSSPQWTPTPEWVSSWRAKLPLQTIMRLLQVLVPQVEKICIDKGLTDESEILKFLQHGTLVGLLPVPHPILIRKYQANSGTTAWFRTYMWGVIYLRNIEPAIWYDTEVKLFEIQRV